MEDKFSHKKNKDLGEDSQNSSSFDFGAELKKIRHRLKPQASEKDQEVIKQVILEKKVIEAEKEKVLVPEIKNVIEPENKSITPKKKKPLKKAQVFLGETFSEQDSSANINFIANTKEAFFDFLGRKTNAIKSVLLTNEELERDSYENLEADESSAKTKFYVNPFELSSSISLSFFGYAILFLIPLFSIAFISDLFSYKTTLEAEASEALVSIKEGASNLSEFNFVDASSSFSNAEHSFLEIKNIVEEVDVLAKSVSSFSLENSKKYESGKVLLEFGESASSVAKGLSDVALVLSDDTKTLTERLSEMSEILSFVSTDFNKMAVLVKEVDSTVLPLELESYWEESQALLPLIQKDFNRFLNLSSALSDILGHKEKKRYLVVFQNSTELRATGGFPGSFALVDVLDGEIVNIEIPGGGPYDLQGSLSVSVIPPAPLQLVSERWEFQDANWFPDFPTSAEKMAWFYGKSGGSSVDGVIALNTFLFQDILELVGAVEMPEYELTVDHNNFLEEIQRHVEIDYDKELNQPKKLIADMAPIVLNRLFNLSVEDYVDLAMFLNEGLVKKDLMIYLRDPSLERKIIDLGWGGEMKVSNRDYLMVVNSNIAGGKTDSVIDQKMNLLTTVTNKGEVFNELIIQRTHNGEKENPFTGVRNVNYLRVYVPEGSQLMEAEGFEPVPDIYFDDVSEGSVVDETLSKLQKGARYHIDDSTIIKEEFGKTVFGNWTQLDLGESQEIRLLYKLPFKIDFGKKQSGEDIIENARLWFYGDGTREFSYYSLLHQKQPGSWNGKFSQRVVIPSKWEIYQAYPNSLRVSDNVLIIEDTLDQDKVYSAVLLEK